MYPAELEYSPRQLFALALGVYLRPSEVPSALVVVRLAPRWAAHAKSHRWHDSQQVDNATDGVFAKLAVRVCPELEAWVLSFGDEAEVLEPLSLRERIAERKRRQGALYARPE